ncbi:hypothetical protein AA0118_g4375 [Alternaria tenuissima]|nr:hypothetical protein AA0118_g4375 [Alternaria tenuissima]
MHFSKIAGLALSLTIPATGIYAPRSSVPEPASPIVSKLFCDVVRGLVTVAKQQTQATPFCSSYLEIPAVTKTSTKTSFTATITQTNTITSGSITTTATTVTATAEETRTKTASATVTEFTTITSTSTTVSPPTTTLSPRCLTVRDERKRAAAVATKKPTCLANYIEGQALSSACKCLSVPTTSTTWTAVVNIPTTTTTSVTVPRTVVATATITQTNTATVIVTNTETVTSTIVTQTTELIAPTVLLLC